MGGRTVEWFGRVRRIALDWRINCHEARNSLLQCELSISLSLLRSPILNFWLRVMALNASSVPSEKSCHQNKDSKETKSHGFWNNYCSVALSVRTSTCKPPVDLWLMSRWTSQNGTCPQARGGGDQLLGSPLLIRLQAPSLVFQGIWRVKTMPAWGNRWPGEKRKNKGWFPAHLVPR